MDILRGIIQETRLKVNPSPILSPAKNMPIARHTNISGLGKSQDNDPKVKSPGSSPAKNVSGDELNKVSVLETSQGKIQKNYPKVKSSREQTITVSALGKSLNIVQADGSLVRPPSNLATVKCAPSEKPNNVPELGKSQDNFQAKDPKVKSCSNLPTSKHRSSEEVTDVSESGKERDKIRSIYPKLRSSGLTTVDDYTMVYSSPFDSLHHQAETNEAKVKSSHDVSIVRDTPGFQNTDLFPGTFPTNNPTDTPTSSKGTWKCSLCGYFAPLKPPKHDFSLLDIHPGANRKCKLCNQWRP
jgi:hypothetical protein